MSAFLQNCFDACVTIVAGIAALIGMVAYFFIGVPVAGLVAGWIIARDYVMADPDIPRASARLKALKETPTK